MFRGEETFFCGAYKSTEQKALESREESISTASHFQ